MIAQADTATLILNSAQRLVQARGYNAFSYADIAKEVGVRTATIHYHFPTKADLARELVVRYRAGFRADLTRIDWETNDPRRKLERYADIHRVAMGDGEHLCLCTMLTADLTTLDLTVQEQVALFSQDNEKWLADVLIAGRTAGVLQFKDPVEVEARLLFAGVEGAALVARCYHDVSLFDPILFRLLSALEVRS